MKFKSCPSRHNFQNHEIRENVIRYDMESLPAPKNREYNSYYQALPYGIRTILFMISLVHKIIKIVTEITLN